MSFRPQRNLSMRLEPRDEDAIRTLAGHLRGTYRGFLTQTDVVRFALQEAARTVAASQPKP